MLLREDSIPPMQWPLGRVLKVHPGSDGIVRTVTIKTAASMLDRTVKRLVTLPYQPDEDNDSIEPASEQSGQTPDLTMQS